MMRKIIHLFGVLALLCYSGVAFSHKGYNIAVNRAELAIVEANYGEAALFYAEAFRLNGKPLAIDVQNALINAIALKDATQAFKYAGMLSSIGAGASYFENKAAFKWLRSQQGWTELLTRAGRDKKALLQRSGTVINDLTEMRRRYNEIVDASFDESRRDEISGLTNEKKAIEKKLFAWIELHGYPDEYTIGLNIEHDTLIDLPVFSSILQMSYMPDLFSHEIVYKEPDALVNILLAAEERGQVSYNYILSVISNQAVEQLRIPVILSGCQVYMYASDSPALKGLHEKREAAGLCSLEDYLRKLRFNMEQETAFTIEPDIRQRLRKTCRPASDPAALRTFTFIGNINDCTR